MPRYWQLAFCMLLGGCSLLPGNLERRLELPRLSVEGQEYYHLVNRLKSLDFTVDFDKLRLSWTFTPHYFLTLDSEKTALAAIHQLSSSGDFKGCLQKSGEVLLYNYTSLVAHNWASYCAYSQGMQQTAEYHSDLLDNLLYVLLATGDGDSPQAPWQVTGPGELSGLLLLLGMRIESIEPAREEEFANLVRIRAWDQIENRQRLFWADYSIPIARYSAAQEFMNTRIQPFDKE
ncbi:MAG: hypothetical protein ACR2PW_04005 [Gammaproteobacteria bacterium]